MNGEKHIQNDGDVRCSMRFPLVQNQTVDFTCLQHVTINNKREKWLRFLCFGSQCFVSHTQTCRHENSMMMFRVFLAFSTNWSNPNRYRFVVSTLCSVNAQVAQPLLLLRLSNDMNQCER